MRTALLALFACPAFAQTTWYVDASVPGPGSGTLNDPYQSVQFAIDQGSTVSGDTLMLLPGTFTENIDLSGKSLAVVGQQGAELTHLVPAVDGPTVRIATGEGDGTRLVGLTLRDGLDYLPGGGEGLGLHADGVTVEIEDCEIRDNGSDFAGALLGSGLFARDSDLTIRGTLFRHNRARKLGGAVYTTSSTVRFEDCEFRDNGGALSSDEAPSIYGTDSQITVEESLFQTNHAVFNAACIYLESGSLTVRDSTFWANDCWGDASVVRAKGTIVFEDCHFQNNQNDQGRGALILSGQVTMTRCTVANSTASLDLAGGAIVFTGGQAVLTEVEVLSARAGSGAGLLVEGGHVDLHGCRFSGNQAGFLNPNSEGRGSAMLTLGNGSITATGCVVDGNSCTPQVPGTGSVIEGDVVLQHCTILTNFATDGTATPVVDASLVNSIVRNTYLPSLGGSSTATYSNIRGGAPGVGNFDAPPQLDQHFQPLPGSPCIDAGDPAWGQQADGSPVDVGALPWTWVEISSGYCTANANSTGAIGRLSAHGTEAVGSGPLYLAARSLPPGEPGLFLVADQTAQIPNFGQGYLCLGGSLARFAATQVTAGGTMTQTVEKDALPFAPPVAVQPGETWNFQAWHRDGATSNTTYGVSVTFQ